MFGGVLLAWQLKTIPLAVGLMLAAMVLSAPATAGDDPAKVAKAEVEQSSTALPLPEKRFADAQESPISVSDGRQVSGNRRIRIASPRRRPCTHLGCRGHIILGIGY